MRRVKLAMVGDMQDTNLSTPCCMHMQVDQARLRLYERSKLRYYYAIVEFDSVQTATRVYTECDGLEFQLSSCKFDLRFVPDEQVSRRGVLMSPLCHRACSS